MHIYLDAYFVDRFTNAFGSFWVQTEFLICLNFFEVIVWHIGWNFLIELALHNEDAELHVRYLLMFLETPPFNVEAGILISFFHDFFNLDGDKKVSRSELFCWIWLYSRNRTFSIIKISQTTRLIPIVGIFELI